MNCSNKYHISDWSVYAILCSYAIKSVVETACIPCKIICQIITNNKGIFFKSVAKLNSLYYTFSLTFIKTVQMQALFWFQCYHLWFRFVSVAPRPHRLVTAYFAKPAILCNLCKYMFIK